MVLPLYLAMTAEEMEKAGPLPPYSAVFHPGIPLPGAMLILTDREPPEDPGALIQAVKALNCSSVLLDFEGEPDSASRAVAAALFDALPCPVAVPPGFANDSGSPVFLPPCPLHVPLAEYLGPWRGREIWLDVTLQQETVTVTPEGTRYSFPAPADRQDGGWFDDMLLCQCVMDLSDNAVQFTLFDTPETLKLKLEQAASLGVTRAVGLYQELNGKL